MKKENIFKSIAVVLGYLVLFAIVQIATALVAHIFVQEPTQNSNSLIALISLILFFVIMLIFYKIRRESLWARIKWNPVPKKTYGLVAIFVISNILALNFLMSFLLPQDWVEGAVEYTATYAGGGFILAFALVVLAAPFVEEVLFRGLMTARMLGRLPTWIVVAVPTLLFGIGHFSGGMGQVVGTMAIGLVFTLTFIWTKSLRAAVLAHVLNNLFVFAGDFLQWSALFDSVNESVQLMLGIVFAAITVFSGYMIYRRWDKNVPSVFIDSKGA